jgi:aminomethyltransferase
MVPFAGWEMPIYYRSILEEHRAVRMKAGLFDVSHLGHLEVSGPSAVSQLQLLVTQDLKSLEPGAACYSPMLTVQGWILDEMILYRLADENIRLVVNAASGDKVLRWLRSRMGSPARVEDLRERFGTLALQGPKASEILSKISRVVLREIRRYHLVSSEATDRKVWIARTGYTGEDGCELFVAAEDLPSVWEALLEAGRPLGLCPIGLGARDTLRLEAGLPLGGSDLDEKTTPLEAGLDWAVEWRKGPFLGRQALERQKREGILRRLCGFELCHPGVPRAGYSLIHAEAAVGRVTSGTSVPGTYEEKAPNPVLMRGIGMGYLPPLLAKPGTQIQVEIHQRKVEAEVVKLPFYRRKK